MSQAFELEQGDVQCWVPCTRKLYIQVREGADAEDR